MTDEKKAQELYVEFQVIEQHIRQMQKQLDAITHQLIELSITTNSLENFDKMKAGKEAFVPLSSGIFAKAIINDTSQLLVNVGANIVVQKNVADTQKLMQKQMEEMKKIQKQMIEDLDKMTERAAELEGELQGLMPKQ